MLLQATPYVFLAVTRAASLKLLSGADAMVGGIPKEGLLAPLMASLTRKDYVTTLSRCPRGGASTVYGFPFTSTHGSITRTMLERT